MEPLRKSISLDERKAKSTAWALTFADVVTLLLTFFVLLLVMLNDAEKTINVVIDKLLDKTYAQMTNVIFLISKVFAYTNNNICFCCFSCFAIL